MGNAVFQSTQLCEEYGMCIVPTEIHVHSVLGQIGHPKNKKQKTFKFSVIKHGGQPEIFIPKQLHQKVTLIKHVTLHDKEMERNHNASIVIKDSTHK